MPRTNEREGDMGLTRKQMEAEAAVKHLLGKKVEVEVVVDLPAPKPKKAAKKKVK